MVNDPKADQFVWQCNHRPDGDKATMWKGIIIVDQQRDVPVFHIRPLSFCDKGRWKPLLGTYVGLDGWYATAEEAIATIRQGYHDKTAAADRILDQLTELLADPNEQTH
jgi:hypothetical protein